MKFYSVHNRNLENYELLPSNRRGVDYEFKTRRFHSEMSYARPTYTLVDETISQIQDFSELLRPRLYFLGLNWGKNKDFETNPILSLKNSDQFRTQVIQNLYGYFDNMPQVEIIACQQYRVLIDEFKIGEIFDREAYMKEFWAKGIKKILVEAWEEFKERDIEKIKKEMEVPKMGVAYETQISIGKRLVRENTGGKQNYFFVA